MASSPSMAQVCMESSEWHKISIMHHEDAGAIGTASSPSSELLPFAAHQPPSPLERRLRPQHEQALKCPRCDSTHTKFCYYNNYSLSQPRYFCKTCRRYWTKGGSLRNVPVGGGCRKNKRSSSAASSKIIKPTAVNDQILSSAALPPSLFSSYRDAAATDLHLSFSSNPRLPHLDPLIDAPRNLNFMDFKYNHGLDQNSTSGFDFIESCKFGAMLGNSMGNMGPIGFNGIGFGSTAFSVDGSHGAFVEPPVNDGNAKSGSRMLSLEWQEQGCAEVERDSFSGYTNGLGLWAGMINGHHGSSSAAI